MLFSLRAMYTAFSRCEVGGHVAYIPAPPAYVGRARRRLYVTMLSQYHAKRIANSPGCARCCNLSCIWLPARVKTCGDSSYLKPFSAKATFLPYWRYLPSAGISPTGMILRLSSQNTPSRCSISRQKLSIARSLWAAKTIDSGGYYNSMPAELRNIFSVAFRLCIPLARNLIAPSSPRCHDMGYVERKRDYSLGLRQSTADNICLLSIESNNV